MEEVQNLEDWNETDRPYPKHLLMHQLLERQAAAHPDAIAVAWGQQALSHGALSRRAEWWASQLRGIGIGPDRLVGVHLNRTPELLAVLVGILKAGGAYLPLDPEYPPDHLQFIATDAGMSALITSHPHAWPSLGPQVPLLIPGEAGAPVAAAGPGEGARLPCHPSPPSQVPGPENLAYVLYTSGSTGRPKGIAITHANAVDLLHWAAEVFGADLERVLAATSICFDCSILEIFGPLSWGGTVVLADSPTDIGARVDGSQVRLLHTVPSVVDNLLRTERLPGTVRTAIVGGEVLGPALARRLYERSSIERLVNLYGPAECTSYASMSVVDRRPDAAPSIGRPVANTRIYLLDPEGEQVARGGAGEIYIAGDGLARGYLGRPQLTAERFVPEPFSRRRGARMYRSGDIGRLDEHGELRFLGRADDQVKIRGVRLEPEEVEQALLAHGMVRETAVAVSASGPRELLTAYVVPASADALQPEAMRAFLRDKLPQPLIPDVFVVMDRLPRLPNGKIDRRNLAASAGPAPCAASGAVPCSASGPLAPARAPWEAVLARLWAHAVGTEDVDVHTDLFSLGGHSLAALRVKAELSDLLGEDVPIRLFFEATVAGLAAELASRFGEIPSLSPRSGGVPGWPPRAPDPGALSLAQRAILARADHQADAPGLHLPVAVRLSGRLNAAALAQAITAIIRMHHILGSRVAAEPDGPGRLVAAAYSSGAPAGRSPRGALPVIDVSGVSPRWRADIAKQVARALLDRPIRVRAEPPLRVGLLRVADDEHVLLLNLHHIAGDAWSVATLSHQVLSLYSAAVHGRPIPVPAAAQYADWAAHQQRRLDSPAGQVQRSHWQSLLADAPVLQMRGDAGRSGPVGKIAYDFTEIPPETVARLGRLGRSEGATLSMVLTAGFAVLLHRWTGQSDIVIGSPLAGRIRSELATVIGPCQDALPLRCDLGGNPSFLEIVRRIRARTLEAFAHGDVPFVALSAGRTADPSRHPVYQASIVYQQPPSLLDPQYRARLFASEDIGDLRILPFLEAEPGSTALDVEMMLFERDSQIEIVANCRSDVVPAVDVRLLTFGYPAILQAAVDQPQMLLSQLMTVAKKAYDGISVPICPTNLQP